jgi:hypothetical protein
MSVALKIIISGDAEISEDEYDMQNEIIHIQSLRKSLLSHFPSFSEISVATRMSAARQLLKALECLHNAGIVRRGELTPACLMIIDVSQG